MNWLENRTFKILSFIILLFFSWTFGGFFDLAFAAKEIGTLNHSVQGKAPKKEKQAGEKFSKALEDIKDIVQAVQAVQTVQEKKTEKNKLKAKKQEIEDHDRELKKKFKETEKKLIDAGLPQEILQRHYDFVKQYEENLKELLANIDEIDNAQNNFDIDEKAEKAKKFLNKVKPKKKHIPLDPNKLPHRTPDVIKKEPRLKKEDFLKDSSQQSVVSSQENTKSQKQILVASNGPLTGLLDSPISNLKSQDPALLFQDVFPIPHSEFETPNLLLAQASNPPTSADLAETIEVQFTPAITTKALELENNPVKIYNWVRNNIEFVPTYGSIQGADYCLQTKLCNAFDTASLLIALFRVSGIHARYVEGTIEIPIEKVKNWVGGFTDSIAALDFIASGGIPVTGLISGGEVVMVRMEHVWVEAYVDYIPYRGAVTGPGDTWIPLDASYKQYNYVSGIDIDVAVPRDYNALLAEVVNQSTINNEIPSITSFPGDIIQNHGSDFKTRLNSYLNTNFPQVDNYYELDKTLHGYREIIQKKLRFLPNTLAEIIVVTKLTTFSEVPDTLRHKINFKLSSTELIFGNTSFTYTAFLPDIAGKRITLSYNPATPSDAQVMSSADGILNFPLYLVEVIPELKIESQTVATGDKVRMGLDQTFERFFCRPQGSTGYAVNNVYAGEYYAIGLNVNKVNFQYLYDRANIWQPDTAEDRDDRLGELLYLNSMFYFAWSDFFADKLARSNNIISLRHTSECLVGMRFNASYVFGTPVSISSVGLNMDVDRDVISVASKTNDSNTKLGFMIQTGLFGSSLEHSIFESVMGLDSISAIRYLDLANEQNIPIYILNTENSQRIEELEISYEDKQDIRNLINAGSLVLVPKSNIQYFDYTGIGYIALNMETGDGAYRISGGLNGGDTVRQISEELVALALELLGKKSGVSAGYMVTINTILDTYPYIADSPVEDYPEFKEWSEGVLSKIDADNATGGPLEIFIATDILYKLKDMLVQLTIKF